MKIGFLITARMKSTRLPKKLIREFSDRRLIEHVIDRIKEVKDLKTIVLCTSTNPQDKILNDISIENDIYYFNGNEEDVLMRLLTAAKLYDLDYLIGITGENPLFSIKHTREVITEAKTNEFDFIYPQGLPIGCATYAIKTKALELVCKVKDIIDTEIWGYLINRPEIFNNNLFQVENEYYWPDLRITCDYPEDLKFIKTIFEETTYNERLDLSYILNFLKRHKAITDINKDKIQLDLEENLKKRINDYFNNNLDLILEEKRKIYGI